MDQDKTTYLNREGRTPAGAGAHFATPGGNVDPDATRAMPGDAPRGSAASDTTVSIPAGEVPADVAAYGAASGRGAAGGYAAGGYAAGGYAAGGAGYPSHVPSSAPDLGATRVSQSAPSGYPAGVPTAQAYGAGVPGYDSFGAAPAGSVAAPSRYADQSGLPQNPVYAPQQTTYMPRAAAPRVAQSQQRVYPEAPRPDYDAYGQESEDSKRGGSWVVKKILIVLAVFFAVSVVFSLISGAMNGTGTTADSAQTDAAQSADSSSQTVSLDGLQGQYWSNAKKMLKSRGANMSDVVVLTDNGNPVVVESNWTVSSIYYNSDGKIEVQLAHKSSGDNAATDSTNGLSDLSNKVDDLGNTVSGLGDTVSGLGDTVMGLIDNLTGALNNQ